MSECKHRWAIRNGAVFLDDLSEPVQEVFCVRCGQTVNDLLDDKERQLESAARDVALDMCDNCKIGGKHGSDVCKRCAARWRKRWEEESDGQNGNHQTGC